MGNFGSRHMTNSCVNKRRRATAASSGKAMAVAVAWLVIVTFVPEVGSPPRQAHCAPGEYFYFGICCKLCPAGTYVEEGCSFPNTLGICQSCTDGESYTEYENGLEHCLPCDVCKSGYKMMITCTTKKNTECQCDDGYFCSQGCEECLKCRTWCPEGQVIVQSCNATTDMKCGPAYTESAASSFIWLYIIGAFLLLVVVLFLAWIRYKLRRYPSVTEKEKEEAKVNLIPVNNENINLNVEASAVSQDELPETAERSNLGLVSKEEDSLLPNMSSISPSLEVALLNKQSSTGNHVLRFNIAAMEPKKVENVYFEIKDMVGSDDWKKLMRKCDLSDNHIDRIIHDYPHNTDEQRYWMLKTLQDREGLGSALNKTMVALQQINLNGIYENLIQKLENIK